MGKWRYNILFGTMIVGCVALAGQLGMMLRDSGKECKKLAQSYERITIPIPAKQGSIFIRGNRSFQCVALIAKHPSCYADPEMLDDKKLPDMITPIGAA